ncbi:MAG: glycosyltransferase [Magnetococcales bacterium]|nr:glycosyltransferase [Magnetococcales bacterium]
MSPLQLVVVIPCYDEPDLLITLDSLWQCRPPPGPVEVVVVINGAETDPPSVQAHHQRTWEAAQAWIEGHQDARRRFHLLFEPALPARQAGVGTARKIGMDWAMTRFTGTQRDDGVIVCLDADCVVADNYWEALYTHFVAWPQTPGCSIYFEHPWIEWPPDQQQGIIHYELYLRYYLHGLRWSGFPHAFHTIGSSMAVRAAPYRRQGGMNRRKAGEDFYFLQKIIPLGGFSDLCTTTVFPSARTSHRVPFGTGRAMADGLAGDRDLGLVYDPRVFQSLGVWFRQVERLYAGAVPAGLAELPDAVQQFLAQQHWADRLEEMRAHVSSLPAFRKRFFQGFNAFQVLKYVHFATEQRWPKVPVEQAAATLLTGMGVACAATDSASLLACYRQLDRVGFWCASLGGR